MQNFDARIFRYVSAWLWIISRNAKLHPVLLILTISFGVSARLSTILGFVVSIKSAIWIFQPETIPPIFYEYLPVNQQTIFTVLILVPGLVFLLTGQLRYLHGNYALRLQTEFSNYSAYEISLINLNSKESYELNDTITYVKIASELKKNYAKLFALEIILLDLLVLVLVVIISLSIGLLINWFIVSIIMGLGFALISIFVWKRHQDRNNLELLEAELRQAEALSVAVLTSTPSLSDEKKVDVASKITHLIENISKIRGINQKFRTRSDLMMDMGQSMIVIVFLALLLNSSIQSMQVEHLVILALLFRFIISYGKAIVQAILKLSPFYKFVVAIQKMLEIKK